MWKRCHHVHNTWRIMAMSVSYKVKEVACEVVRYDPEINIPILQKTLNMSFYLQIPTTCTFEVKSSIYKKRDNNLDFWILIYSRLFCWGRACGCGRERGNNWPRRLWSIQTFAEIIQFKWIMQKNESFTLNPAAEVPCEVVAYYSVHPSIHPSSIRPPLI